MKDLTNNQIKNLAKDRMQAAAEDPFDQIKETFNSILDCLDKNQIPSETCIENMTDAY